MAGCWSLGRGYHGRFKQGAVVDVRNGFIGVWMNVLPR